MCETCGYIPKPWRIFFRFSLVISLKIVDGKYGQRGCRVNLLRHEALRCQPHRTLGSGKHWQRCLRINNAGQYFPALKIIGDENDAW